MGIKLKPIYIRFHSFGGMRLIREYFRMGLLPMIMKRTIQTVIRGRSLENVVDATYSEVDKFLRKKYRPLMLQLIEKYQHIGGVQNILPKYGFAGYKDLKTLLHW